MAPIARPAAAPVWGAGRVAAEGEVGIITRLLAVIPLGVLDPGRTYLLGLLHAQWFGSTMNTSTPLPSASSRCGLGITCPMTAAVASSAKIA